MNGTLTVGALSVPRFRSAAVRTRPRRSLRTLALAAPTVAPPAASRTLYEVLRVKETASAAEIKAAYRALAKRFHPDADPAASPGPGDDFIKIHRAYATLSDPSARAQYDRSIVWLGFPGHYAWSRTRRWETDQCW